MKILILGLFVVTISGCATNDYALYLETKKSISRDNTIAEAARLNALIEMTKNSDPAVRAVGLMMLQQLQQTTKKTEIELPKRNRFSF